jgi:ABC-type multidrug transport system fused ATPase/permease subunit
VLIVVIFAAKGLIVFARIVFAERIVSSLVLRLQTQLIESFSRISYVYYAQLKTGTLTNLIFTEVERFARSFSKFISVIATGLTVCFYLAGAALIRFDLTAGIVVAGFFALFLFRFLVRRTQEISIEMSGESAQAHANLIQTLQSFLYLRASGAMDRMTGRVRERLSALIRLRVKLATISATLHSIVEPFAVVLLAVLIIIQVEVEGRAIAEIVVLALLCHRAFTRLMTVQQEMQRFNESVGGVVTVQREGGLLEEHGEADGEAIIEHLSEDIVFDGVTFRYGDVPAIEGLDLTIPKNNTIGIVGESGAGKSTLILLLAGVIDPTEGAVRAGARDYREFKRQSLHEKVGYVTQDPVIFNGTIAENITMFGDDPADPDVRTRIEAAAVAAHCADFVSRMDEGYDTMLGERGVNLSGGQKQRVAIARELYKDPALMILDEATSALDTESERAIQDSIERMRGERTIVVIAHRLSTVRHCDRIVVLSRGRIIETGTFDSLVSDESSQFHALVEAQRL